MVLITDNDINDISRLNQTILAINNSTTFEKVTSLERKERDVFFQRVCHMLIEYDIQSVPKKTEPKLTAITS